MEIEKVSQDNFTLVKEDNQYVLYMGNIKRGTPRAFTLKITAEDSSKIGVHPKCGCTTNDLKIVDKNSILTTLSYNNCDTVFTKTVEISNNGKKTILKIKGACQNT